MNSLDIRKKSGGQIALIVLLASAVLLTLGLSTSKKATVDTRVDTDQELLKQAFNTAESGVDYYLSTGTTSYTTSDGKSQANVTVSNIGGGANLVSDGLVLQNNTFLFWLVDHTTTGEIGSSGYSGDNLKIAVDSGFNKALKVDYFYKKVDDTFGVDRFVYNFNGGSVVTGASSVTSGVNEVSMTKIGTPYLIAVTPIGGPTNIALSGSENFPLQGEELTSVGTAVGVNSQVKVNNRYKVPSFMLDAITANGSVLSNN